MRPGSTTAAWTSPATTARTGCSRRHGGVTPPSPSPRRNSPTWRVTAGKDTRSTDDRLYSAFPAALVLDALEDAEVLHDSEETSQSSGRLVHRVVVRRTAAMVGR